MTRFLSHSSRLRFGTRWPAGLLVLGLVACGPADDGPSVFTAEDAIPLALPELERQEPATRERIVALRNRALSTLEREPLDPAAVAEAHGELGAHLAALGFFEAAADGFETARRAAPDAFRWHYFLGVARQDDSKLEAAVDAYADALEREPDQVPARLHRLDALIELDRLDEATTEMDALRARLGDEVQDHAAVRFALARVAAAQGRHAEAVEHFERVLELQPGASAVHYPLSQAYLRLGERDLAEYHLGLRGDRRPTFEDPLVAELGSLKSLTSLEVVRSRVTREDFDPTSDLGFALANLGQVGGVVERMEQIVANDAELRAVPRHEARFRYVLGGLWVNRGRDAAAEPHFRRALELDPESASTRVKLGNLLARRGALDEALEHYSLALDAEPLNGAARIKRAAVLSRLGRHGDALVDLRTAFKNPGTRAEASAPLAATLDRLGRTAEADDLLRSALRTMDEAEEKATLHEVIADRHKDRGRFDQALASYAEALSLSPSRVSASLDRAAVLGHLGRWDEAIRAYGDVLAQDPASTEARRGQVTALLLAERYREAARALDAALRSTPDPTSPEHLDWSHALARVLAACPEDAVRDGARALELANRAFDARPSLKRGETLAMAHAEHGDFEQAATIQRNLVAEARNAGRADVATRLGRVLALYEGGRAFRASGAGDLIVSSPVDGGAS